MYHQIQESGACAPLLMGYTQPEKIQEDNEESVIYDQKSQTVVIVLMAKTKTTRSKTTSTGRLKLKDTKTTSD